MSGGREEFDVILKRVAPELEKSVDTTNHTAGKQSFFPLHELGL
jgi:hypothetical protein